jgi:hypothetical protein
VCLSALSFCSCSPPFEAGDEVEGELVDEVGVEMAGEAGDEVEDELAGEVGVEMAGEAGDDFEGDFEGDFEDDFAGQYAVQQFGALAAGAV